MKEIQDKIYDAYYFKFGNEFGQKVRERVHWIVQNTKGNEILEIGCSQGIVSILLGREGKNVLGIDVSDSTIQEAQHNLEKEEEETKQFVQFEKGNFFLKEFDRQFDVVVLGEVLEHISDIYTFFHKVVEVTKDDGTIIVTTPFGINDFIDHKRTFYLKDFFELQQYGVRINDIKFFGKWIGLVYEKNNNPLTLNLEHLEEFEIALYNLERSLITEITQFKERNGSLNRQLKEKKLNVDELTEKYIREKTQNVYLQNELLQEYKKQEDLLKKNKVLQNDIEKLKMKYKKLSNSKLGRLTLKYWKFRNRTRG